TDAFAQKGPVVLRAYRAGDLTDVLFDSSKVAANQAGPAVKFTVPTIADGKVLVGTGTELDIYGLGSSGGDAGSDPAAADPAAKTTSTSFHTDTQVNNSSFTATTAIANMEQWPV